MKTVLTSLLTVFVSFAFGQNYYKAVQTEVHKKNTYTNKWELLDQNKNTSIDIVSENNLLNIQAQSPTMYKLYSLDKEEIVHEKFNGYRYRATELKNDINCTVELLYHKETGYVIISVLYSDYNLRYFVEPKN